MEDDKVLQTGTIPTPNIGPGGSEIVTIPYNTPSMLMPGSDYWLNISFTLASDTSWAPRGHEVAWAQFQLPLEVPSVPMMKISSMQPVVYEDSENMIQVTGANFDLIFDKV